MQTPPPDLIQRQLLAYNAKDIEGFLATYAPDAEQYVLHGERLAKGHGEMRPAFSPGLPSPTCMPAFSPGPRWATWSWIWK